MSQSSQIFCTQDIGDYSDMEEDDVEEGWGSLISTQDSSRRFYCTEDTEYTIGRDKSASFVISENYVSSIHCSILKDEYVVFMVDHSTNGTFVSRGNSTEKIGKGNRYILQNGDKIILIKQNLKLKIGLLHR